MRGRERRWRDSESRGVGEGRERQEKVGGERQSERSEKRVG